MLIFRLLSVMSLLVLAGCADAPTKASAATPTVAPVKLAEVKEKTPPKEIKTSINPDVLFMLLTAEIAGQRGQYAVALEGYLEAAKRTRDAHFAERAAMIAMYMKNGKKTNEAVALWLRLDGKNAGARKIAALSAIRRGDKKATVEHLNALLAQDPAGFDNAVLELAGAAQKDGKLPAVYEAMETLSVQHPNQAVVYFMQSLLAMQTKDKNLAEAKIKRALQIQPDWDKALIFQAQIAVFSDDMATAKSLLQDASRKYPGNIKISKMLAQVLIKAEDYASAVTVYQGLVAADPKDIDSQFALGLVFMQLDKDGQAEDVFQKLLDQAEWQSQARFYLGKLEEKREHIKKAIVWYEKVNDGPLVFDAAVSAISLLAKDKQFDDANARLSILAEQFPKQKLRLVLMQAELLSQQKQYDKSFTVLTQALVDFPEQKELLYTRALIAERLNKLDVTEADLKKILATDAENVEALNALGYTLLNKTQRYADAEKYLQLALKLEPDAAVIIDSYGWLQFKLGHADKALGYLQQAYDKQPETEIAAHLSEVLWALGKKDEARKLFEKAIKASPDDEYLLDFKRRILSGASE